MDESAEPFDHVVAKDGCVRVRWHGREVVVLAGASARKFLARSQTLEGAELQLLLARVTGNFKRGNEGLGKQRGE